MAIKRICDACGAAYDVSRCVKRGRRYYCPICRDKPNMKCAINMQLPDGSLKTLVYSVRRIADACAKAKKEHPTWEITGVSWKQ